MSDDLSATQSVRPTLEHQSTSSLHVERIVDCPFSLAVQEAPHVFEALESPGAGVRIPFRKIGLPLAGAFTRDVTIRVHLQRDHTEPGRLHDEAAFGWEAHSKWLPDLHGALRFRVDGVKTRVILSGEYVPPFGAFGALFDRVIGRNLARATAADILERLTTALETSWSAEENA